MIFGKQSVSLSMVLLVFAAFAQADAALAGNMTIETKYLALDLSPSGKVVRLEDKLQKKSYLPKGSPLPFMQIRTMDKTVDISSLSRTGDVLSASFGDSGFTATFKLDVHEEFFTIAVESVSEGKFFYLDFVRLPATITQTIARNINAAYDDDFAVAVMAVTPTTNAVFLGRGPHHVLLGARCWPEVATRGVQAVVFGCKAASLLSAIGKVELACGLPHLTVNGQWWKQSKEIQKGYLLCNPTGDDIQKAIAFAKRGGIPYITFLDGAWRTSSGHYPINTKNFPKGEADLKATVDKIHAQGMKAGMHFLSACISKGDAYVTPVPDKRLDKDGELTLAQDIDGKSRVVPTTEVPVGFLTDAHYGTRGGVDIQIDDEIIHYAGINSEAPFGFTKCRRGFYGTKAAAHRAGAKVYHITQRYNMFLADPKTDLVDEIAERLAHIYNTCGFDMVYFDGGEAMSSTGPHWYTISLIHRAFAARVQRAVLWQGSGSTHYSWHFFGRGNCDDYVCLDPKAFCDQHKTPRIERSYNPNFIAAELGWWSCLTHSPAYFSTVPDELTYMCAKAVGWNAAINLECNIGALERNGRTGEALDRMKIWQDLQHSSYFSEATKQELRKPEMDFTLVKGQDKTWRVQPVKYHPDHIADPQVEQTRSWKINNTMAKGRVAGRIRAMTELAPYGADGNVVLFDPRKSDEITTTKASDGVTVKGEMSAEQIKTSQASCKLVMTRGKRAGRHWAMIEHEFDKPLNLTSHRALGVWLHGDRQGEVVNVQIEDRKHQLRDYYIDVDFTGWRYFTLDSPATRRVWDYSWPYNCKWTLRYFDYSAVRAVNIYVTHLKVGTTTTVFVDKIEALRESPATLKNPTVAVGDNSVMIPVEMQPDEYIEFSSDGQCRHFDPNGHVLGALRCPLPPAVVVGENLVRFSSEANARANVTLIVKGSLLRNVTQP